MNDYPEDRCRNCGAVKEPDRLHESLCAKCADFLEPSERIEIKIPKQFLREIHEAMKLGYYGTNRTAFISEAIRRYIRYLKGEQEEKNVSRGVEDALAMKIAQTSRVLRDTLHNLEGTS